jgi:methionine sulfoxide reductase heme-binding subunit
MRLVTRVLGALHAFIKSKWFYPAVFIGCLVPALQLGWQIYQGDLGVNPVETLEHTTGEDALALLLTSLCITPARRIFGWNKLQLVRRMVGVWAFAYALVHFSIYLVFDQSGSLSGIVVDVVKRKFILVGMLAFLILLALAVTSTNGMIRRLGRNWVRLHRLVYVAATAGVIHFIWGQKVSLPQGLVVHGLGDLWRFVWNLVQFEPLKWAIWLAVLFGIRLFYVARRRRRPPRLAVSS